VPAACRVPRRPQARASKRDQMVLLPSGPAKIPHSTLSASSVLSPRAPGLSACSPGSGRLVGAEAEPSVRSRRMTDPDRDSVNVERVRAYTVASMACSLATSRTVSTRWSSRCSMRWWQTKARDFRGAPQLCRQVARVPPRVGCARWVGQRMLHMTPLSLARPKRSRSSGGWANKGVSQDGTSRPYRGPNRAHGPDPRVLAAAFRSRRPATSPRRRLPRPRCTPGAVPRHACGPSRHPSPLTTPLRWDPPW
jgi:hypothetical protein